MRGLAIALAALAAAGALGAPVNVLFIFHNHQPWYLAGGELALPWVRMHSVANYIKVPLLVSQHVPAAFTLSGSLIEQINWYVNGTYTDARFRISEKLARGIPLTEAEKYAMLQVPGGFFDINWANILQRNPRYAALLGVRNDAFARCPPGNASCVLSRFTDQDLLDLAVLFNLLWIDPGLARANASIWALRNGTRFTREDLALVLDFHMRLMREVLPTYARLAREGKVELVPVPYSHPLMPLLADMGLLDDLRLHVSLSQGLFRRYLGVEAAGVWPPEQAVNDAVLRLFAEAGYLWTVTDEDVLRATLGPQADHFRLYYAEYGGRRIYVLFRDKYLSDGLGFRYASLTPRQALADFVSYLARAPRDNCSVVVVALDGENPWENYPNFGDDFLAEFFRGVAELEKNGTVRVWRPTDFVKACAAAAGELPQRQFSYLDLSVDVTPFRSLDELPRRAVVGRIAEGSWSGGGTLSVWIGDPDENSWWMWLRAAREAVGLPRNWTALFPLLVAEASDWPFWYGGEFGSPQTFDPIAKAALAEFYRRNGLRPPAYLNCSCYPGGTPREVAGRGQGGLSIGDIAIRANHTHIAVECRAGVVYVSNPALPRSPYLGWGSAVGLDGGPLGIYADLAYHCGSGLMYLAGPAGLVPIGRLNAVPLSAVRAAPGGRLYVQVGGLVYLLEVPEAPTAAVRLLLYAEDPAGDDYGPGRYQYPLNPVFKPGVFDLRAFAVYDLGDRLRFVFRVADLGGNPWGGPAGFSLQFFHVYINRGAGTRNDTLGLRVALCREAAWDVALLVGPGWPGGNRIVYGDGRYVDDAMSIRALNDTAVAADVPKRYLGDFGPGWRLTVFLTSWDGYGPDNIRSFGVRADEWTVGGADPLAVLAGVAPRVMDLLAPTADLQKVQLSSYRVWRAPNGTYVGTPAVVCSYTSQTSITPQTAFTTTYTATVYTTVTATLASTTTLVLPTTVTAAPPAAPPQPHLALLAGAVGLAVGLLAGLAARRKR